MPEPSVLLTMLDECPPGHSGWRQYEDACIEILKYLFVPPLHNPQIRERSISGLDIRDAIFPNRSMDNVTVWGQLRHELGARLVLFEFKNYDVEDIGSREVDQVRNYMTQEMGRLGIMVSNKEPHVNARTRRNEVYLRERKLILLLTSNHLREMIYMKERGDDPALLIMEQVELVYMEC